MNTLPPSPARTAEPWEINPHNPDTLEIWNPATAEAICQVFGNSETNARVIAAAPSYHAALERIAEIAGGYLDLPLESISQGCTAQERLIKTLYAIAFDALDSRPVATAGRT